MKRNQQIHMRRVINSAQGLIREKYIRGAEQHGGDLMSKTEMELVDEAIGEAIDQLVYLLTLRDKLCQR